MPNNSISPTGLLDSAKTFLPKVAGVGATTLTVIVWLIVIVILAIITTIVIVLYINSRRYRNRLVIFEKINNVWVDTRLDKGMELKFGEMGIKVMYFKNLKRYEPFPKIQSGNRKFYYKLFPDGTLINFRLPDLETDEEAHKMEMNQAMLYHHTGINRGLENRYEKQDWKAYIPMIVGIGAIIIICIFVWLIMDKWMNLAQTTNQGVELANKVLDRTDAILGKLDNVLSHETSGYVPAK